MEARVQLGVTIELLPLLSSNANNRESSFSFSLLPPFTFSSPLRLQMFLQRIFSPLIPRRETNTSNLIAPTSAQLCDFSFAASPSHFSIFSASHSSSFAPLSHLILSSVSNDVA
ncbi:hypothetical protein RYX36_033830 [Vicia faba]